MSIVRLNADGRKEKVPEPEPTFDVVRVFWMRECAECYGLIVPFQRAKFRRGRWFHHDTACFDNWWSKWKANLRWVERDDD